MINLTSIHRWAWYVVFAVLILVLYVPNVTRYGVMTPWEMNRVSRAIDLATDGSQAWMAVQHVEEEGDIAPLPLWAAAVGFKLFGVSAVGGRIPSVVLLLAALLMTFWSVSRLVGRRAAYFSTLIFATLPMTGFHGLQIGGHGIGISLLAIALAAIALARWWNRPAEDADGECACGSCGGKPCPWCRGLVLLLAAAALAGSYFALGGIVGLLFPVATVAIAQLIAGDWRLFVPRTAREFARGEGIFSAVLSLLFFAGFAVICVAVIPAAVSKVAEFNLLTGGVPRVGAVPIVDYYIEHIAFSLYPWSALLPAGIAALFLPRLLGGGGGDGEEPALSPPRLFFALACFLGFAAVNFFAFRFSNIPFVAVMPAAVACGVLVSDLERSGTSWKTVGIIGCLFLLLFFRDLAMYPASMSEPMTTQSLKDAFPVKMLPREAFALFTIVFMTVVFYVFWQGTRQVAFLGWFQAPLAVLKALRGGYGAKWKWTARVAAVLWALAVLNAIFIAVRLPVVPFNVLTSIARKACYALAAAPLAALAGDFCFRLVYNAFASARDFRIDGLAAAGFVYGLWFFNGYMPDVTKHLSPTAPLEFVRKHAGPKDELLTYRVKGKLARFYGLTNVPVREVTNQATLLKELEKDKRVFLLYGREDNPSLNLAYKEERHEHLYVPESSTWRFLLGSNRPLPGFPQANPIRNIVRMVPPEPQYHVYANLDNKVEYLGYDLVTDHDGKWAGALEHFTLVTYWHCTDKVPGSYQFFIHVDGFGLRQNGDHEPLDGLYPTRYWRPGDYLVDTYRMQVPIHFRAGDYTIYLGLFQGETRVKQVAGPTSGDDRIEAGILRVK